MGQLDSGRLGGGLGVVGLPPVEAVAGFAEVSFAGDGGACWSCARWGLF